MRILGQIGIDEIQSGIEVYISDPQSRSCVLKTTVFESLTSQQGHHTDLISCGLPPASPLHNLEERRWEIVRPCDKRSYGENQEMVLVSLRLGKNTHLVTLYKNYIIVKFRVLLEYDLFGNDKVGLSNIYVFPITSMLWF